ncbi:formyltetrahydrofolate deformylase [Salinarimonas ramus]|uniref:Formyltetrahydrofolate deformylase n=1 Tax=Salinarimonas ramus TaxID=690164 RepID=A0A917QCB5_9HYPH|nr:formyltetrahydrofolate deformylase [Salinarimonas ramus]GGK42480.1 formyltetrahydrofolate deformylase [Salinarimonas ramus]
MKLDDPKFVLKLSCIDTIGIVHAISGFMVQNGCNIITNQQFGDRDTERFFMRVAFTPVDPDTSIERLRAPLDTLAARYDMDWTLHDTSDRPRVIIMVSKFGHCLNDLLYRWKIGALKVDIAAIVSNHRDFEDLANRYEIPFHHMPVTPETKQAQEAALAALVEDLRVDLVVLARYMQVLSDGMCRFLEGRAINIHHSFLPSFKGAAPYTQAWARGVKLIGATAHYVTPDLDEGPIIEQEVVRVSHEDGPAQLTALGRDVESVVLARAVAFHVERRVLLNGNRTVVFR